MADYYKGIEPQGKKISKDKDNYDTKAMSMAYVSVILGLLSLLVIIALNITNIAIAIKKETGDKQDRTEISRIGEEVQTIVQDIQMDLRPKTNLINNMVSYQIPNSLNQIYTTLRRDVLKACTPQFNYNKTQCPLASNPIHSGSFSLLQRNFIQRCNDPNQNLYVNEPVKLMEFPSFIPGPTKPGGCCRNPSFSLSARLFAYTHNIVTNGCNESLDTTQYWAIGRVTDVDSDMPYFEILRGWYIDDGLNRKTCTVAAGEFGAWIACILSTESDLTDYRNPGVSRVFLGYMDIYGRKHEWYLNEQDITFSDSLAAMFFSIGSGIVENGKVYFLVYGGLLNSYGGNALCDAPRCSNPSQDTCNEAQAPLDSNRRQMVNGILYFDDDIGKPIRPRVKIISPSKNWFGYKGRLIASPLESYAYIYIATGSWYTFPKLGLIALDDDFDLVWITNTAYGMPGPYPCDANSHCPKLCKNDIYTDLFPLDGIYEYSIGLLFNTVSGKYDPAVTLINRQRILYRQSLLSTNQEADLTTTTCFRYSKNLWCLSIVSLLPATIGSQQPVPLLYKILLKCRVPLGRVMPAITPIFNKTVDYSSTNFTLYDNYQSTLKPPEQSHGLKEQDFDTTREANNITVVTTPTFYFNLTNSTRFSTSHTDDNLTATTTSALGTSSSSAHNATIISVTTINSTDYVSRVTTPSPVMSSVGDPTTHSITERNGTVTYTVNTTIVESRDLTSVISTAFRALVSLVLSTSESTTDQPQTVKTPSPSLTAGTQVTPTTQGDHTTMTTRINQNSTTSLGTTTSGEESKTIHATTTDN